MFLTLYISQIMYFDNNVLTISDLSESEKSRLVLFFLFVIKQDESTLFDFVVEVHHLLQ